MQWGERAYCERSERRCEGEGLIVLDSGICAVVMDGGCCCFCAGSRGLEGVTLRAMVGRVVLGMLLRGGGVGAL